MIQNKICKRNDEPKNKLQNRIWSKENDEQKERSVQVVGKKMRKQAKSMMRMSLMEEAHHMGHRQYRERERYDQFVYHNCGTKQSGQLETEKHSYKFAY